MTTKQEDNTSPRRDLYREITDRIIKAMEENKAPWQRPWTELAELGMPQNGLSGRNYNGVNSVLLFLTAQEHGYDDSRWMTFKQANERGYKIRKGEKSSSIYFYKPLTIEEKDKKTGENIKKEIPYLCEYHVFNAAQIDGLPTKTQREPDWDPIEQAERLVQQLNVEIRHGGNRAYFSCSEGYIQMPSRGAFPDAEAYYGTLLHEIGHWTGHETRLNRQFGRFGDDAYAREELRAEWSSAMVSAEWGIPTTTENHAA